MTIWEWIKEAHEPIFIRHPVGIVDIKYNRATGCIFYKLIWEEVRELLLAVLRVDKWAKVEIVDALGDIMWLCATMLACMGIDYHEVMEKIAESNATKLLDGEVFPDKYGKIRKGVHYVPPKLDDLV